MFLGDPGLAADSHCACRMRRIIGLGLAAAFVLLQLAGLATLGTEADIYLAPIEGSEVLFEQRA